MTEYDTMWEYLKDSPIQKKDFEKAWYTYYGRFMERLGRRIIREYMDKDKLSAVFPDVEVISSEVWSQYGFGKSTGKIFKQHKEGMHHPDAVYVLHVKKNSNYDKYAVAFEIKSGRSNIQKSHCDFWRDFISQPDQYIKKCSKAKIFMMWIHGVSEETQSVFYTIKEIIPEEFPPDDQDALASRL